MNNIIFGFLLTDYKYPFFKYDTKIDTIQYMHSWHESVCRNSLKAVVFIDEPNSYLISTYESPNISFVLTDAKPLNQMDSRWVILRDYIKNNPSIERFFITDIGDCTILKNPFSFIEEGKVYVGDENNVVGIEWMRSRVELIGNYECSQNYLLMRGLRLLNCGIFGGYVNTVMPTLDKVVSKLLQYNCKTDTVDMIAFNEVLHLDTFNAEIVYGKPLNTKFWDWDLYNQECYFQHK